MLDDEVDDEVQDEELTRIDDELDERGVVLLELLVEVVEVVRVQLLHLELELDECLLLDMLVELSISLDEIVNIYVIDIVYIALLQVEL